MSYQYEAHKNFIFSEIGQKTFLQIRDNAHKLIKKSGAAALGNIIECITDAGNSWSHMACVDRLVELGEITEITDEHVAGQDRIFV